MTLRGCKSIVQMAIHGLLMFVVFWLDPLGVFTGKLCTAQFTFAKTVTCAKAQRLPRAPCRAAYRNCFVLQICKRFVVQIRDAHML